MGKMPDYLLTGNALVDGQHANIYQMCLDMRQAIMEGRSRIFLKDFLPELVHHVEEHFRDEAKQYKDWYATEEECRQHSAEHRFMLTKIRELKKDFDDGIFVVSVQIADFIKQWIINHIEKFDRPVIERIQKGKK
jgi:hemerythrin-like metal-binding protein